MTDPAGASGQPPYAPPPAPGPTSPASSPYQGGSPVLPAAKKQTSPRTYSIISLVAGAVSFLLFPMIAGFVGVVVGITTIAQNRGDIKAGAPGSRAVLIMSSLGILLGATGLVLNYFILD
ncbi:hypothetical protein [Microbacterium sp. NPDC057650]|uniref:hypothetical protein n=1 Tax=unclassified Microbacterium TaxID=2609290 RepID=UPI00366B8F94